MKLRITVEGVTYDVDVEVLEEDGHAPVTSTRKAPIPAPAPRAPNAAPSSPGPPSSGGAPKTTAPTGDSKSQIKSPIAGLVESIAVKAGDTVKVNDTLLVIEAMKMESTVASPVAGTVKAVRVEAGQAVRMGDVLVEFE